MMIFRKWRWLMLYLFLFSAGARIIFVLTLQPGFYFWDSVRYDYAAVNLINQGEFGQEYDRSPAYPIFLAGVYQVVGQSVTSVRLVEALLGGLVSVLIAFIGRRTVGPEAGLVGGLIWAIYPLGVFLAALVYPETLMTVGIAGAVALLLLGLARPVRPWALFLAGTCLLVATLTKPVVLATFLAIGAWLVFWEGRPGLARVGLFLAGFLLPLALWSGASYYLFGKVIVNDSRAGRLVDRVGSSSSDEVRKGRIQRTIEDPAGFLKGYGSEFLHFWRIAPERVVMTEPALRDRFHERDSRVVQRTVFVTNSLTSWATTLSIGPVFVFGLIGLFFLTRNRQWRELTLMAAVVLSFAFAYSLFFNQLRYRIPVEPFIILVAAYGFVRLTSLVLVRLGKTRAGGFWLDKPARTSEAAR
jgi:4-amino-4-deoxy-L-arabinose transferase-like glycosyltransferase